MRAFSSTWPALFAWGAGLVHIALGASIVAGSAPAPAIVVVVLLLLLGAGELVWGAASLRAGRIVVPRTKVAGAVGGIALAAAALAVGCAPVAVAAALVLATAAACVSARRKDPAPGRSRSWTTTVGTVAGAILVAALVTPALSTADTAAHSGQLPAGSHDPHAGH
ncbi:hypothetical protein [Microbacterium elymi]|uniref:Uncharacterized protein n=1 Tax=Microbacterium elymi TaxID=2909587 RepID=A0ABY5NK84_9MICO|nr:hypothetical protein [Microbacterium elymi]UUT35583.1 hypothetical protein L2X98_19930 [Microbacterium elymi]